MAYIGVQPRLGNFQACDAITASATTTFNLLVGGTAIFPQSAQHCLVSLNGVLQAPISSYTISGSTIVFASALTSADSIDFITILGDTLDLGVPSDDTVGAAQIKADLISGTTALAAEPADTDEFLVSDAGVLKRIDYSLIKGASGDVTTIDSIFKADLKIGEDNDTKIDFETANQIHLYTNGSKRMEMLSTGKIVHDANSSGDLAYHMKNTNSSNPYGLSVEFTGAAPDNNTQYFFRGEDTGAVRVLIQSDGDLVNHDNSYGQTSDERIKQNITDANSQWNDIKAIKVKNFQRKDDVAKYGINKKIQIGVIAQELEASNMNGLVKDEVLYTAEDKEVIDGDKNVGDINTYKSVKYSVLYMKAIKALQEAMAKIETLETKVQALEDA